MLFAIVYHGKCRSILIMICFVYSLSLTLALLVSNTVIPGEAAVKQHRILVMDMRIRSVKNQQRAFVVSPEAKSDKNETPGGGQKMCRGQ